MEIVYLTPDYHQNPCKHCESRQYDDQCPDCNRCDECHHICGECGFCENCCECD